VPWLDDIAFVLEEEDVAERGVNLYGTSAAKMPKLASGAAIHIADTGGTSPERIHNLTIKPGYLNTTAQVTSRGATYEAAEALAWEAWYALFAVRNRFVGSGDIQPWYMWIKPLQNPTDLGVDGVGNIKVGFNIEGRMRP
jgi:hypothetical protein